MLNKLKIGTLLLLTLTACSPNSVHSVTSNPQPASAPVQQSATQATFQQTLANLEQQYQARIGVYVWDTETGHSLSYRAVFLLYTPYTSYMLNHFLIQPLDQPHSLN